MKLILYELYIFISNPVFVLLTLLVPAVLFVVL